MAAFICLKYKEYTVGPIYRNHLGPGCVRITGFFGSSSQPSYTCTYLYNFYNEIQANFLSSALEPDHYLTTRLRMLLYCIQKSEMLSCLCSKCFVMYAPHPLL